jgi:hypothetical protein
MITRYNDFINESEGGSPRNFSIVEPDDNYPFKMISDTTHHTYDFETGEYVDKNLVIGVVPVIFSYRIRAGYNDLNDYNLDYCAGSNPVMVQNLFNIILNILRYKKDDPFKGWPFQNIKPFFKDDENFPDLLKMLPKKDIVKIEIPDLLEIRKIYYDRNNIKYR